MNIEYTDNLNVSVCRANPAKVYVYGDNLAGYGTAGQACIRKEPNAFGIPTKRYPSMANGSFFTDKECERNHVLTALRKLYTISKSNVIVFPSKGIGTGLAKMSQTSPIIYGEMCDILLKHLNIRNVQ